jgi:fructose-bisphosphate aldolase class I
LVLMDGGLTIERCAEVTQPCSRSLGPESNRVALEHMLLKPSMVVAGKSRQDRRRRSSRRSDSARAEAKRAGGRAGHLFLVRRTDLPRQVPSRRDQPARTAALGAELLL